MVFSAPGEEAVFRLFNDHMANPVLDIVMSFLSLDALPWTMGIAFCVLGFVRYKKRFLSVAAMLALVMLTTQLVTYTGKTTVGRVRPYAALAETRYIDEQGAWQVRPHDFTPDMAAKGNSFPSGHSSISMALCLFIALVRPSWRLLVLFPIAVGLSRLYLGRHYPTDVLAGWFIGAVIAYLGWYILTRLRKEPPAT